MSTKTEICSAWITTNVVGNKALENNMTKAHNLMNAERIANNQPEISKGVFREKFNAQFPERTINLKTVQSAEFLKANPKYLELPKARGYAALIKSLPEDETIAPNVFNRAYDAAKIAASILLQTAEFEAVTAPSNEPEEAKEEPVTEEVTSEVAAPKKKRAKK
jgi:hypothetical protein